MRQIQFLVTSLLLAISFTASAQTTFTYTVFDPPNSIETHAFGINDAGTAVGYYKDSTTGLYVGYTRKSNGTYKTLAISGDNTYLVGINDTGTLVGYYYPATGPEQTFSITSGKLSLFAFPGSTQTQIDGIDRNGDFAGIYLSSPTFFPGFLHVASTGQDISFSVPGAAATFPQGLNNKLVSVGQFTNTIPYSTFNAFIRSAVGVVTIFGFPGAAQTTAYGINDCGIIVGDWLDAQNVYHGFYGSFGHLTTLDYPGATLTAVTGLNDKGTLIGSFKDSAGVRHGLIATPTIAKCAI